MRQIFFKFLRAHRNQVIDVEGLSVDCRTKPRLCRLLRRPGRTLSSTALALVGADWLGCGGGLELLLV